MTFDPATLCLTIHAAFGPLPYPGAAHIVRDNSGADLESLAICDALHGQHWRDVSFDTLDGLRSALPFLSPAGYRFYLPAFLIFSIVDFPRADIIPDEVIRTLTWPNPADLDRLRALAQIHPEMQPFAGAEWEQILATLTTSYRSGEPEVTFQERIAGFDPAQNKAIYQFLIYMRAVHGEDFSDHAPDRALERYWNRYA